MSSFQNTTSLSFLAFFVFFFFVNFNNSVSAATMSRPSIVRKHCALLICDMQTKFEPLIYRSASVINNIALLNNMANVLEIPVYVTEQYPKAFGHTCKVSKECSWINNVLLALR